MTARSLWMMALVALALGMLTRSASAATGDPPGELWILASPAECPDTAGPLVDYARQIREQSDAAIRLLQRTPRFLTTRANLRDALAGKPTGWLFLMFSGHGDGEGSSKVCVDNGSGKGEWLDINRDLLPQLPTTLSGAVIVLDSCRSAHVDPRLAHIPTAILSASPNIVETGALFGVTVLAALAAASDENCSGAFDDDDLFTGVSRRLQSSLSLVKFEAWPKLRRNAASPLPIPVRAQRPSRCADLDRTVAAIPAPSLPRPLVEQRDAQAALGRGSLALPHLDRDYYVFDDDDAAVRAAAGEAGLTELRGLDAAHAAALAQTTSFVDIFRFERSFGWLRTWRLRDGALISVVRLARPACGMPSRVVSSDTELVEDDVKRRYSQADRYVRDVSTAPSSAPSGAAIACYEAEGQCFNVKTARTQRKGCEP